MRVESLMTKNPATCSYADSLASAAMQMWHEDCGILPVADGTALEGVITDRDIAMALGIQGRPATDVRVGEVITGELYACAPGDEVSTALEVMGEHRVRRLPVVEEGRLVGLLSLNDIVLEAASKPGPAKKPTYAQVTKTLQAICAHRQVPTLA